MEGTDVDTGLKQGSGDNPPACSVQKTQKQLEKEAKKKAKNDEKLAKFQAKQAKLKDQSSTPAVVDYGHKAKLFQNLCVNINIGICFL